MSEERQGLEIRHPTSTIKMDHEQLRGRTHVPVWGTVELTSMHQEVKLHPIADKEEPLQ